VIGHRVALVTGATSGIGAAFAERFALDGYSLILTGRRVEKLNASAQRLRSEHGVDVRVIFAELSAPQGQDAVIAAIRETPQLETLVNNAGFGLRGQFHAEPIDGLLGMLNVHCATTARLMHAALPSMLARRLGCIINVSSLAAFLPYPGNAMYAATKAFVNSLTETVYVELRGTGVRVQALCPGMTRTDFQTRLGERPAYPKRGLRRALTAEEVVECSLAALAKDRCVCVPGAHNQWSSLMARKFPRAVVHRIVAGMFGRGTKERASGEER
jgi:short-subunit dehydrogenase